MFNFLKDKIKSWVGKSKVDEEIELKKIAKAEKSVKKPKKTKEKKPAKIKKEKPAKKTKQKETKPKQPKKKQKKESITKIEEQKEEITKEIIKEQIKEEKIEHEKVEEKKGFFASVLGLGKKEKVEEKPEEKPKQEVVPDYNLTEPQRVGNAVWQDIKQEAEKFEKEQEEKKQSIFDFLKRKLTDDKFEELFQDLELAMLQNNVAFEVVEKIKDNLSKQLIGKNLSEIDLKEELKKAISSILIETDDFIIKMKLALQIKTPVVIALVGINGTGKTTTIAKLAHLLKKNNISVCLAAADTFRAASIEQLEQHAIKLEIPIIKKEYGSDPASVGFDAIQYAKAHNIQVVLIDTAGRMNTKESLMKEIEKITRVAKADIKIFIGESITGNDAIEQAKAFNEAIKIDGIILSKADIDEKGGTAISVSYITQRPILFLGTGQTYDDLKPFKKQYILESLGLD